jgi:hypothetical protein
MGFDGGKGRGPLVVIPRIAIEGGKVQWIPCTNQNWPYPCQDAATELFESGVIRIDFRAPASTPSFLQLSRANLQSSAPQLRLAEET